MSAAVPSWLVWSLLSASFAACTAIFAKIGIGGIDSDLATLIRTVMIVAILAAMLFFQGKLVSLPVVTGRTWLFLLLSGVATGASWLCYFRALQLGDAARVAPIDKLSVVLVAIIGVTVLGETLPARGWAGVALIATGAILVATA